MTTIQDQYCGASLDTTLSEAISAHAMILRKLLLENKQAKLVQQ